MKTLLLGALVLSAACAEHDQCEAGITRGIACLGDQHLSAREQREADRVVASEIAQCKLNYAMGTPEARERAKRFSKALASLPCDQIVSMFGGR